MVKVKDFKGYEIFVNETNGWFHAPALRMLDLSLSALEKEITVAVNAQMAEKRVLVCENNFVGGSYKFVECIVLWVGNGHLKVKHTLGNVVIQASQAFEVTEKNREICEHITAITEQIDTLDDERVDLYDELEIAKLDRND